MSDIFAGLTHTPAQHFTLFFYAAVLRVLDHASNHFGSPEAAVERVPFLSGYFDEMAGLGLDGASFAEAHERWRDGIVAWERASRGQLPLVALREATGLSHDDLILLVSIGLPDEDPRFGLVFDAIHGGAGGHRPTLALLAAGWPSTDRFDARGSAHRLHSLGLVEQVPGDTAALRPCAAVWHAMRSASLAATESWIRHRAVGSLPGLESLILPAAVAEECRRIPELIVRGAAAAVIIRGPRHNGRATLAAALARALGKGVLDVASLDGPQDPRWRIATALACLLNAALLTAADPAPSEAVELPHAPCDVVPFFVTVGGTGALSGPLAERAVTVRVPMPDRDARATLWNRALGHDVNGLSALRLPTGNIMRAAKVARASTDATVDHTGSATLRAAVRTLDRAGLEALARRVDTSGDFSQLALSSETLAELTALGARCRQRERLGAFVGEALGTLGPGVRALFKGPSGTGKTLAARMLAGALGMDLYRVDLSCVVNKYIGETEKNLERLFARAEELDVILLLDEGDALLTQRTSVQSANDRYANLETNYLLQRLESYEGILLVTTNAGERIDGAFQRRMDVVIDFNMPDAPQRWAIWQLHLPARHEVDMPVLQSAVQRCTMSGGQIRNAALHATLMAMESDTPVASRHLVAAIEREYRKQGSLSPLRVRSEAP